MRIMCSILLIICAGLCSCRRNDYRTVNIYVPKMKNRACAEVVVNALRRQEGIRSRDIAVDMSSRIVTVRYDSIERSIKNLEYTIADAGFAANEIPATTEAVNALPAECEIPKVPVGPRTSGQRMW